ncbi:NADH-dependent alcohol dehydrogenase [Psychromonas sp. MB-3u-54]|uniref:iron-containing alcohol dehydrogenase n=1 Tax=Psychromonas sp. MB-3u-54 TaxID=2058319 RepID=UPI000C3480CA|nr:iron-containing alcohol dehydrogenase [Psychromonas sp. MB-3u-54]PKH01175.1 NADH-dependent alcohol dehydrogenase [Psychromonas sp. MB-3u-54]
MDNFTFFNNTRIHFGQGQISKITSEIPKDKKVLVLYGGGSIKKNGVYDQVKAALADHNWSEFSGIEPNPKYDTLLKAVAIIKAENFDYLLAVGGGSVVDGTKFIAAACKFEGADPWDILETKAAVNCALTLGCILTLPATGSESNGNAVVMREHDKLAFNSPLVCPAFAILDPTTTLSLSPRQSANGVVGAFVHVMEQYLTYPVNAKVQDRFAEALLLNLIEEGPRVLKTPDDLSVRSNLMWSATQALNGLIGAGVPQDWTSHGIGHELTGHYGIDHARSLSIILPAVMNICRIEKEDKLLQYGERVFAITEGSIDQRIDQAIAQTIHFFTIMNVPTTLNHAGLERASIEVLLKSLKKHGMVALGEKGNNDLSRSRKILEAAL